MLRAWRAADAFCMSIIRRVKWLHITPPLNDKLIEYIKQEYKGNKGEKMSGSVIYF